MVTICTYSTTGSADISTLGHLVASAVSTIVEPFRRVKSAIDKSVLDVQTAISQHKRLVDDAASALSVFEQVRKRPTCDYQAADSYYNQFNLEEAFNNASTALERVEQSNYLLGESDVRRKLEDPERYGALPRGSAKATIKALRQCQRDGGLTYTTFVPVEKGSTIGSTW